MLEYGIFREFLILVSFQVCKIDYMYVGVIFGGKGYIGSGV